MVDFLYSNIVGRLFLKLLLHTGILKVLAIWVRRPSSRLLISPFIKKNQIDMSEFAGCKFNSYADFFARKKEIAGIDMSPEVLISPCDSLLSLYELEEGTVLHVKNAHYNLMDLIPEKEVVSQFTNGLCLIFRLRATDYHHYCYPDDCIQGKSHFIPGLLHSVQPIACEKEPVYRVNRRLWSILETANFGPIAQMEIGAVLVGGMVHEKEQGSAKRGEEMGHFELAGSTIMWLMTKETAEKIDFIDALQGMTNSETEVEVKIGQKIGRLTE